MENSQEKEKKAGGSSYYQVLTITAVRATARKTIQNGLNDVLPVIQDFQAPLFGITKRKKPIFFQPLSA